MEVLWLSESDEINIVLMHPAELVEHFIYCIYHICTYLLKTKAHC
jgi:hypothetical protein